MYRRRSGGASGFQVRLSSGWEVLAQGEDVTIVGFGRFTTKRRMARSRRNPRTGEALEIPEATVPVFKASKILRNAVNRD